MSVERLSCVPFILCVFGTVGESCLREYLRERGDEERQHQRIAPGPPTLVRISSSVLPQHLHVTLIFCDYNLRLLHVLSQGLVKSLDPGGDQVRFWENTRSDSDLPIVLLGYISWLRRVYLNRKKRNCLQRWIQKGASKDLSCANVLHTDTAHQQGDAPIMRSMRSMREQGILKQQQFRTGRICDDSMNGSDM